MADIETEGYFMANAYVTVPVVMFLAGTLLPTLFSYNVLV